MTYQTPSGLEYRTSGDASLGSWSGAHPLGHGLASRMIDGALAFTGHGVILGFKAGTTTQHFEIAWAPSLSAPFRIIGQPDISVYDDTVENYEFVTAAGAWHLVATSNTLDQPFIFTLGPGNPSVPSTWLHWQAGRELSVPSESFNSSNGMSSVNFDMPTRRSSAWAPMARTTSPTPAAPTSTSFGGWGHASSSSHGQRPGQFERATALFDQGATSSMAMPSGARNCSEKGWPFSSTTPAWSTPNARGVLPRARSEPPSGTAKARRPPLHERDRPGPPGLR